MTSTAKHTPGKWRVAEGRSIEAFFEGEWVQIASINRSRWSAPNHDKNVRLDATREGDSALIASASELPHNCEHENCTGGRLMRELESLTPGGSEYVGDVGRCIEAIKTSREMHRKIAAKLRERMNELRDINAELLDDAHERDRSDGWFIERLRELLKEPLSEAQREARISSIIAHVEAHRAGTRAAISKAEGRQ